LEGENLDKILRLLSIVILADKRVYKEEVDTMCSQLLKLYVDICPGVLLTDSMVREWFQSNRASIHSAINGPYRIEFISDTLISLNRFPHRKKLFEVLLSISYSDGEYHKDERSVIFMAQKHWKLD